MNDDLISVNQTIARNIAEQNAIMRAFIAAVAAGNVSFDSITTNTIELGNPSDTTLSRLSAGVMGVEGIAVLTALTGLRSVALQAFTASGTYTPTSGMKYCLVISTGAGGGGGGADCTDATALALGGGGGGGATCIELFNAATIGASQTVTIGTGGTAGANTGTDGGAGGNTTFGALHTAGGGVGGDGISNGDFASTAVGNNVAGGTATGGLINIPGGKGQSGTYDDVCFTTIGGAGGSSFWGGPNWSNRQTVVATAAAGANGTIPGQGGGGANCENTTTGAAGGTGANGICIVLEFI